jgi:hypothetical protein
LKTIIKLNCLAAVLGVTILLSGCQPKPQKNKKPKKEDPVRLSFAKISGIKYHEVNRRFSSGLAFNDMGFQQEPSWIMQFVSDDSVRVYSPQRKVMQGFHVLYDHGDVYNFAGEWFRIKAIHKDSLLMQRLSLQKQVIANDIRSDVRMKFYSEDYIKNVLHTRPELLQRPSPADTAYIRALCARSNRNPSLVDSAFGATQTVRFKPKSKAISVEKLSSVDKLSGKMASYDYLYPEYRVVIHKAYQDFAYSFTCVVDQHGKIYLDKFRDDMPEYHEQRKKVLEGIINIYLQNLLQVSPGTTLGMPHSSQITVNVVGRMK